MSYLPRACYFKALTHYVNHITRSIRFPKTHFHVYKSEILHVRLMAYSEVQPQLKSHPNSRDAVYAGTLYALGEV